MNPLRQRIPCGCQCLRVPPPYRTQSPLACIPVWLLLPYGNQSPAASVLLFPDKRSPLEVAPRSLEELCSDDHK